MSVRHRTKRLNFLNSAPWSYTPLLALLMQVSFQAQLNGLDFTTAWISRQCAAPALDDDMSYSKPNRMA